MRPTPPPRPKAPSSRRAGVTGRTFLPGCGPRCIVLFHHVLGLWIHPPRFGASLGIVEARKYPKRGPILRGSGAESHHKRASQDARTASTGSRRDPHPRSCRDRSQTRLPERSAPGDHRLRWHTRELQRAPVHFVHDPQNLCATSDRIEIATKGRLYPPGTSVRPTSSTIPSNSFVGRSARRDDIR